MRIYIRLYLKDAEKTHPFPENIPNRNYIETDRQNGIKWRALGAFAL